MALSLALHRPGGLSSSSSEKKGVVCILMLTIERTNRVLAILAFVLGASALGCKSAAPAAPPATSAHLAKAVAAVPVAQIDVEAKFTPAEIAADSMGMRLVVASPMKLVADLDGLSQGLQLPFSLGQSFLPLLTSGAAPGGLRVDVDALERLEPARLARARLVAISVPMHTALRLGVGVAARVRAVNPGAHVCFFGLYAVLNARYLLDGVADTVLGGECEEEIGRASCRERV